MKKKIFLIALMVALFVCILAIAVSAEEVYEPSLDTTFTVDNVAYPVWEKDENGTVHPLMWYKDGDKLSSVRADNMSSGNGAYVTYSVWSDSSHVQIGSFVITDVNGNKFNGKETVVIANLSKIYLRNDGRGITLIHKDAFKGSTVLKAVYIPSTIKGMGWENNDNLVPFQDCTALEYAEFAREANMTSLKCNAFLGCTSLKAISLPEGIETIYNSTFTGCTSLQAIYLPSTLKNTTNDKWNNGAFYNCTNAYFVSEPFKLNSTCTNIPAKPSVYYFPEHLASIHEALRNMTNLNDVIIFGEDFVSFDSNSFTGTAPEGATKTVVFKGQMEKFKLGDGINHTINFVFTNTTDESVFATRTDRGYKSSCAYLCKTGRKGALGYGVSWSDGVAHFVEAKKTVVEPATCTTNRIESTYCYCGENIDTDKVIENSALGHNHDIENGATVLDIVYENGYFGAGYKVVKCERCAVEDKTQAIGALFTGLNYSAKEDNSESFGLYVEYLVNQAIIAEYEAALNKKVSYGVVAIMQDKVTGTGPLKVDGTVADGVENVVASDVTNTLLNKVTLIVTGSRSSWTDDKIKGKSIYILGYATNGTSLEYLGESSGASVLRGDITSVKSLAIESSYTEYVPKENVE